MNPADADTQPWALEAEGTEDTSVRISSSTRCGKGVGSTEGKRPVLQQQMDTSEKAVKDVDGKNKQEMEEVKPSSEDAKVVDSIPQHMANTADMENNKDILPVPENNDGKVVDSIPQHKANTADTENNEDILPVPENNDGKVVDSIPQHKADTADTENNEDILPIPDILQDIAPSACGASHEAELALDMEANFQDSAQGAQTAFSEPEEKVDVEGSVGETKTDQVGIDAVDGVYLDSDEDVFDKEALTLKCSATAVSPGLN